MPDARDGPADQIFSAAVPVHLRGVDVSHAEIDADAQRPDLLLCPPWYFAHLPGALTDHRQLDAGGSKFTEYHALLLAVCVALEFVCLRP